MVRMRILIVEDEHKIATAIKKGLVLEGYAADVCFDGEMGYDMAASESYDCIILDLMLPGMDGVTVCKKLRADKNHTPILMLTAKGDLTDKVDGLNAGADDYLVKPFAFEELIARVRALSRRPREVLANQLTVDNLVLDTVTYSVTRAGVSVSLSKKEFSLLEYLMRHPNQTISKDQLREHVWDYDADILPNTVEVYMGYLRTKIDRAFPQYPSLLHTIRGFGYKIAT